ncbi:MAG: hypothetical protein ACLU3I_03780 [Acutalibacteraceae bacterium]
MIALYGGGNVSTCGFSSGGALPDFEAACKRANVPYTAFARPKWCTATVCCRFSGKQRRISRKSRRF